MSESNMNEPNMNESNMSEPNMNESKKEKRFGMMFIIILLLIITLAAIGVTVWALFFRNVESSGGDYAPKQIEGNAEPIDATEAPKLEHPEGGGSVSLTYSNNVTLSLSTKEAELMFQNPYESNQDMKIEIVIDGKAIVESGRLEPGYGVDTLSDVDTDKLSPGAYKGKFVISYYNEASGEKAIVNTEIPITITVVE